MFKHILVPLDGSRLAESALGIAAALARRFDAAITLIHLIEKGAPTEVHSERHLVSVEEAADYLDEVAHLSALTGIRVATHVHASEVSDVATSVREHSAELIPDLIVMSTHGGGGARRLLFGDIAQRVISHGRTPVLVVHASDSDKNAVSNADWRNILVPIDGDPAHEMGLPLASDIAKAFHCRLNLLWVVPTMGVLTGDQAAVSTLQPGTMRLQLEIESEGAQDYLAAKVRKLQSAGVRVRGEAVRGDPSRVILKAARRLPADLVVMGTHGKSGTEAFWAGSVAAKVASAASVPIILVPIASGELSE